MTPHATNDGDGRKKRGAIALSLLQKEYPKATIALKYSNVWELLVAVMLSAQCTDKKVNEVTATLFKKYKKLTNYITADLAEFEVDIRQTGLYRAKAKNILATAKIINETHKGSVPRTMEELTALPGVARKTANIVLGNAYGVVEGIAVDTHVSRISQRLRLVDLEGIGGGKKTRTFTKKGREVVDFKKDANTDKIEQQLMEVLPKKDWFTYTYYIIEHGRTVCVAQSPHCDECVLSKLCPSSRV